MAHVHAWQWDSYEATVLEEDFTSADGHLPSTTHAPGTHERELLTSRIASMRAVCRDMSGRAQSVVYVLLNSSDMEAEYNTASGDFASLECLENIDDTCQVRGFDEDDVVVATGYVLQLLSRSLANLKGKAYYRMASFMGLVVISTQSLGGS
jgi:hypothetical protein